MEYASIVAGQVVIIFIYIALGIMGNRTKMLPEESGTPLSNLSLLFATPAIIINSFQRPLDPSLLGNLGLVFLLATVTHMISVGVALLCVRKGQDNRYRIERFGVAFANSGYMAIPLVQGILGDVGVYYISAFIGVFNLFTWTVGLAMLDPKGKINLKKALLNPGIIGVVIGLGLHLLNFQLPRIPASIVEGLAGLNTPLSMITAGIFLAHVNIRKILTNFRFYYASFLKLVLVPMLMLGLFWILRSFGLLEGRGDVILAVILACACPSAAATVQFSTKYNTGNADYGAELVAVTTLFSVITLPLMALLAGLLV